MDEVEIPRKITLFRVLMERKLGIDWEHSEKQHLGSMDSLQTNDIEERNYKELKDSLKDSLISS